MTFNYREYWESNGERIRKKRKLRYRDDPEYAERQRKWSADYRARKRKAQKRMGKSKPRRRANLRRPVHVEVQGHGGALHFVCWNVGSMARMVGVTRDMINRWEAAGMIPLTPLRDANGGRLYTMEMIAALKAAVATRKHVRARDHLFYYEVLWAWNQAGFKGLRKGSVSSIGEATEISLPRNSGVLLTLDGFADVVGRSVGTVLNWERNGVLPVTPFTYGGKRFYPRSIASEVRKILGGSSTIRYNDKQKIGRIRERFDAEISRLRSLGITRLV